MITREDLIKSSEYWIETIQNKVFNDLIVYIEKNNVSNKSIAESLGLSKGRVSQILSGENLNFRLDTLVKLCLAIERIPDFRLIEINDFVTKDKFASDSIVFMNYETYHGTMINIIKYKLTEEVNNFNVNPEVSFGMTETYYSENKLINKMNAA
jgi:predicted XRE-type DNA-binding protein